MSFNQLDDSYEIVSTNLKKLNFIILNNNNIEAITGKSFSGAKSLEIINLANNPLKEISESAFLINSLRTIFTANSIFKRLTIFTYEDQVSSVFSSSGYVCESDLLYFYCKPCRTGTYKLIKHNKCQECPAGGFYQDEAAYSGVMVHGVGCKECPPGKYVPPDRAPGLDETDCRSCPEGTRLKTFAGFGACSCLEDHYRLHRFHGCFTCTKGYTCLNETINLAAGFFWVWSSKNEAEQYQAFSKQLKISDNSYDRNLIAFKGNIPTAYACPVSDSCLGDLYSECKAGYEGPLCALCSPGYYNFFTKCEKCPSLPWIVGQITLVLLILTCLLIIILKERKEVKGNKRSLTDIILARLKIVIGFYQISSSTFDSLSYIRWPDSLLTVMKYAKMIQLNLLQISPPNCIISTIQTNAYAQFMISVCFPVVVIFCIFCFLLLRKIRICRDNSLSQSIKSDKILTCKENCYRCVLLILFASFPSNCSQIFQILPESCHELCSYAGSQCVSYLRADYSVRCDSPSYRIYGNIGRAALVYVFTFPLFLFGMLKLARKFQMKDFTMSNKNKPIVNGTRFLYENYSTSCWYWEIIELIRKITVSLLMILFSLESRMGLGVTSILSGLYAIVFALYKPIEDKFEYWLQMVSLLASSVNFTVGMLMKIPLEENSSSISNATDSLLVTIVLMTANIVVVGLIIVTYVIEILSTIIKFKKNPECSLSCCLEILQIASQVKTVGESTTQEFDVIKPSQEPMMSNIVKETQESQVEENDDGRDVNCGKH